MLPSATLPNRLPLKQKAIQCINEALRDPRRAKSDRPIAAVAKMAAYKAIYKTYDKYCFHMKGLKKMLKLRVGFDRLGSNGLLMRMCLWIDTNAAFLHNPETRFF